MCSDHCSSLEDWSLRVISRGTLLKVCILVVPFNLCSLWSCSSTAGVHEATSPTPSCRRPLEDPVSARPVIFTAAPVIYGNVLVTLRSGFPESGKDIVVCNHSSFWETGLSSPLALRHALSASHHNARREEPPRTLSSGTPLLLSSIYRAT